MDNIELSSHEERHWELFDAYDGTEENSPLNQGAESGEDTKNWEDLTREQKESRIRVEGAMYEAEVTRWMPVTWPAQWAEVFPGRDLLEFPENYRQPYEESGGVP